MIGVEEGVNVKMVEYLVTTRMLDYESYTISNLISQRRWLDLTPTKRVSSAYNFVRNEILFGYNTYDTLSASEVLADGYGQCNTKTTLLMALLRGLDIPCRFHGFTIDKSLQRGVVPELIYPIAPKNILHSWVEIYFNNKWISLEGFILDEDVLRSLQKAFPGRDSLCAYGAGTDYLQSPKVEWTESDTYIQKTGINHDFGVFDDPDTFYADHRQLSGMRGRVYRYAVRHWMNRRVHKMRRGQVPVIPVEQSQLSPSFRGQIYSGEL